MARVLMIGYGPLPQRGLKLFMAPSLRTRHLLHAVLEGGHTVNLFTLPLPGTEGPEGEVAAMTPDTYEGLTYQRFANHSGEFAIRALNEQVIQLKPDAIVGVNTYPSYIGAMLSTTTPLWCDLHGYWMAEMQARCHAEADDSRLIGAWAIERTIVRRLDRFSASSRPQLHAVLGEMATIGRLNKYTFNYPFGAYIPIAAHRWEEETEGPDAHRPILRGPVVPEDAFIILWSGGFNLWTDIPSLVDSMNQLMGRFPQVHFVSTGGKLDGVDTRTYQVFEEAVAESAFKDRFHRLGWVSSEKIPKIYREANLGINIDGPNYETLFGARNRLNAMAAEGLAIMTTLGTEISEWLVDAEAAISAPMGDAEAIAGAIEPWVEKPAELRNYGRRAKGLMEKEFNYSATTRSLRSWLEHPANAPDNAAKIKQSADELADLNGISINALEGQAVLLETYDPRTLLQTKRELDALRKRLWYRVYQKVRRVFGE